MGSNRTKSTAFMDAMPAFAGEGEVSGYHGTHRDITGHEQRDQQLTRMARKLQRTNEERIEALTLAAEAREHYRVGHHWRVAKLAYAIVCEMGRLPELGHTVRTAALVHDVGKVYVSLEVLTKPGQLSRDEFASIRNHPHTGCQILSNLKFPWPVADVVLQHHERMDGSGYPLGLNGDDIRLEARILGVADSVEAMLHPRSYRPALGMDNALQRIASNKGVLYDPDVVEACLAVLLDRGFKFQSLHSRGLETSGQGQGLNEDLASA